MDFGAASITDAIAIQTDKSKNALGMRLAGYCTVTVDYATRHFYFVANAPAQEFKNIKTSGFDII